MDAFESLVATLLRHEGYWTASSVKVKLTTEEKQKLKKATSPRFECDIVAYKGSINELLIVECKSWIDSAGIRFRNGFQGAKRLKLFTDSSLRQIVFRHLETLLCGSGACAKSPTLKLALATGHIANDGDRGPMHAYFNERGWRLFDEEWIRRGLQKAADDGYENDVAVIVAKLILPRAKKRSAKAKSGDS